MAVADGAGLPLACWIASGERHEAKLVAETLTGRFLRILPRKLIGDMAFDSDALDAELAKHGVELIRPSQPDEKDEDAGRAQAPSLPPTLAHRAALRLAHALPAARHSLS